jgi:NADPH2:quinone reductase
LGARVIAAASSEKKLAFLKQLGADEVINYSQEPVKERLRELTGGRGADVVFDPVGGEVFNQCIRAVNWRGRYLVVGFTSGDIANLPTNLVLLKGSAVIGVYWTEFFKREKEAVQANFSKLTRWIENGDLKPPIFKKIDLKDFQQAFKLIRDRQVMGKIVLIPS